MFIRFMDFFHYSSLVVYGLFFGSVLVKFISIFDGAITRMSEVHTNAINSIITFFGYKPYNQLKCFGYSLKLQLIVVNFVSIQNQT